MSVTVRDIARTAGVSISTVSRVLNGSSHVDDATRSRVEQIIRESGYIHHPRKPAEPPKKRICIVMPATTDNRPYMHPTVHTILTGLTARLGELGIASSHYMLKNTAESVEGMKKSEADGFIFIRTSVDQEDSLIPHLLERERPVIVVNRRLDDKRLSYVNIDDFSAACCAVEHLIRLGHKKIALADGDLSMRNSQLRRDGYLHAMHAAGLTAPESLMVSGEYSEEAGRRMGAMLLSLPESERPTAIFAASDTIACGIQKALIKAGLELPREMSLVGFGDTELASCLTPPLTSVRIPAREMGIQAAMAINHLLSSPSIQTIKIQMKSELCVRASTCRIGAADSTNVSPTERISTCHKSKKTPS